MAQIRFLNVERRFGEVAAVVDFTTTVQDGEFLSILGPSGCGKTTLLRMLAGFERPTQGEIHIGDQLVAGPGTYVPPEQREIGMVFQSYAVWPHMNVFDNIGYPLKVHGVRRDEIRKKVEQILELVHMPGFEKRMPSQLSGGQQQRVALARALIAEPKLLLLDESLSNLDAKLREAMRFELKDLQRRLGITVVYVTHDQAEAMAMSDRICVMRSGMIQQVGTPREIYQSPASRFVADFVGSINFLPGRVVDRKVLVEEAGGAIIACTLPGEASREVIVIIRPEHLRIARTGEPPGDAVGTLSGKVQESFYLGKEVEIRVQVGSLEMRVVAPPDRAPTYGDDVTLYVQEAHAFSNGKAS